MWWVSMAAIPSNLFYIINNDIFYTKNFNQHATLLVHRK